MTHVKSLIETHLLSCVFFNSEIPKNPIRIDAIVKNNLEFASPVFGNCACSATDFDSASVAFSELKDCICTDSELEPGIGSTVVVVVGSTVVIVGSTVVVVVGSTVVVVVGSTVVDSINHYFVRTFNVIFPDFVSN